MKTRKYERKCSRIPTDLLTHICLPLLLLGLTSVKCWQKYWAAGLNSKCSSSPLFGFSYSFSPSIMQLCCSIITLMITQPPLQFNAPPFSSLSTKLSSSEFAWEGGGGGNQQLFPDTHMPHNRTCHKRPMWTTICIHISALSCPIIHLLYQIYTLS